ncbi:HipA domain-containing protein [Ruegeria sp. HU-ET01832]|uniref:type II toxin-antitoxin system HipA family toxin n=1 Tax=Ruegeria sp. HU-ET01832 TaxID=3135906 RepID=UPI003106F7BC
MTREVEIFLDYGGEIRAVGLLRCAPARGTERVLFEYDATWLARNDNFPIDQALPLTGGIFPPSAGMDMFPVIGDTSPDRWGRRLMQRRERRLANQEQRAARTLFETDYVMGVSDVSRIGALRMRWAGQEEFQASTNTGVPGHIALGDLLDVTRRIEAGEETDEDIQMIFAPGASLGGARPKCSVHDVNGHLSIAKFPKQDDEYSVERWEAIAATLARQAGINMASHSLENVNSVPVFLSHRYDRNEDGQRVPYTSAMSMTQHQDGDHGSYLEIVDAITTHGSNAREDRAELFRRLIFTILVSNVDDHLRNHGFLWDGQGGWHLSPAFDINPTSPLEKPRVLQTNIDFDEGTCDINLALSVAEEFGLSTKDARQITSEVGQAVSAWQVVAHQHNTPAREIEFLSGAFEHDDLEQARRL